jgi:hemerythrin
LDKPVQSGRETLSMIFVKTFKGYEDKTRELDDVVNRWISENHVIVGDVKTVLAHEPEGRAKTGDLIYTVLYKADAPIP